LSAASGHPTILIVYEKGEFRDVLILESQRRGYLILVAQNGVEASETVARHSRHIHVLQADDRDGDRVMTEKLKPYRPDMKVSHQKREPFPKQPP
jgi:hypothetical protein